MKAIDTNIVARLILRDDERQYLAARALLDTGVIVPITVLLEIGWLLGSRYRFARAEIAMVLTVLLDTPGIAVDEPDAIRVALELYAQGADFADVIHLVAARGAEAFVTFDRTMPDGEGVGVTVERMG